MDKARKSLIRITVFFALLIGICAVRFGAAEDAGGELKWDPSVVRGRLDNGFTYSIRVNKKPEKRVELRLVVRAGAILEPDGQYGLAHYIEHMGFNGTKHFAAGELVKYFETVGVEFGPDTNAYTWVDDTVYLLTLPTDTPEPLEKGLVTMSDYAGGMLFLPEEIEKERGVILEELRLSRGVQFRILEKGVKIVLKGTRYTDRLVIGTKESVESFKQQNFIDFYNKWYRPDMLSLVVVGDVDPAQVEKRIKEIFSELPAPPPGSEPLPAYPAPQHDDIYSGIVTDPEMPVSLALVVFTRDPIRTRTEADCRQKTIDNIALGIYNNRLNELSLKDKPPFKSAGVNAGWSMKAFDIIGVLAMADMKKEKKALGAVITEIERIRRFGILPEELDEQKRNIEESLRAEVAEQDKRESGGIAGELVSSVIYGDIILDPATRKEMFDRMKDTITVEDVKASVERLFAPKNMTVLFVLPEFQKSMYKESDLIETVEKAQAAEIQPYTREKAVKSTDYAALVPGKIADRKTFDSIGVTEVKFENGMRVFIKPTDFQKDEIIFGSWSLGGMLFEDYGNRGIGTLAAVSWMEGGTKDLTSIQINRMLSGKTVNIRANGAENYSLSGSTVGKDFEETLQWLRDYLTIPGFRDEAVSKEKGLIIDGMKQDDTDQDAAAGNAMRELLCPGNPVSYRPSEDDLNRLTPDQLRKFHETVFSPSGMEFTFVGNLDVEKTIKLAAKYLGSIPAREAAPAPADARVCSPPKGLTRREVYVGMEKRTNVRVVMPGPAKDSPDMPAVTVMSKVVDIRMNDILREELGGTYYAYIYPGSNLYIRGMNFLFAGFATDPDKVEKLLDRMYGIFSDLAANGPTDEEMKRAREVFAKDYEESLKRNGFWLGAINGNDSTGLPLDFELKTREQLQTVTPVQVRDAAKKYLLTDTRIEIIALPEKKNSSQ